MYEDARNSPFSMNTNILQHLHLFLYVLNELKVGY